MSEKITEFGEVAADLGVELARAANDAHTILEVTKKLTGELWVTQSNVRYGYELTQDVAETAGLSHDLAKIAFYDYVAAAGELIGRHKIGDNVLLQENKNAS